MIAQILLSLLMYYFFYQFGDQREERDWSIVFGFCGGALFIYNFAILYFSGNVDKEIGKLHNWKIF